MASFSWKRASGLTVIFGFIVFFGCTQVENSAIADQLEEQLERVLDGKDPEFDKIAIEEYSDAAVIRGKIASLSLSNTLRGMEEREESQSNLGLELEFFDAQLDAIQNDKEFNWTKEEWIKNRLNEIKASKEAKRGEMESEVKEIRNLIAQLRTQ